MKRTILVLTLVVLVTSVSGCNCFRKRQQTLAAAPAPICAPVAVCPPVMSCDPCAQGVTYGMPPTGYMMPTQ